MRDNSREFRCPFCESLLAPPTELRSGLEVFEGGRCTTCSAVYVYDRTGRMLGEALSIALIFANNGDYDKAFSEGGEYEEAVLRYNPRLNIFSLGDGGRLDRSQKFFFLRLKSHKEL